MVMVAIVLAGMGVLLVVMVGRSSWLLVAISQRSKEGSVNYLKKSSLCFAVLLQRLAIDLWHATTVADLPQLWHITLCHTTTMA